MILPGCPSAMGDILQRSPVLLLALLLGLTGCDATVYQSQVASLTPPLVEINTARSTFAATYAKMPASAAARIQFKQLSDGTPLAANTTCVDQAADALSQAEGSLNAGGNLESLYAASGLMAKPVPCSIAFQGAPPTPAVRTLTGEPFVADDLDKAATEDETLCRARTQLPAVPSGAGARSAPLDAKAEFSDDTQMWTAISAYASGLDQLSSAQNMQSLNEAADGATKAIGSAGARLNSKSFAPAINFLAAIFEAAVQKQRFEAFKTAVICANPLFIHMRTPLRDALRYQQIAAFQVETSVFSADADSILKGFNPAAQADCPPVVFPIAAPSTPVASTPSRRWYGRRRWHVTAQQALPRTVLQSSGVAMSPACATARARQIVQSPQATVDQQFAATEYLQNRGTLLDPRLTAAQSEAVAANALAAADPAPAVDAFVKAHMALRQAVERDKGQSAAVKAALQKLYDAAKALNDTLTPAKASS